MKNIMMNKEMAKAILDGAKTQTRRVIKVDPTMYDNPVILEPDSCVKFNFSAGGCQNYSATPLFVNSKYQKGDIVWVREPVVIGEVGFDCFDFRATYLADGKEIKMNTPERFVEREIDGDFLVVKSSPDWLNKGRGIPNGCIKEMARIFLKITDIHVERLQDIGYDKISLEGFDVTYKDCSGLSYEERRFDWWIDLWNKTAPKGYKWEDNPYVFVYEFKRVNKDGSDYNE